MDQFSAHLDRGWDLVQRGDTRGADASARRALEIDPQSPEAYNLLGYVAALEGEASEAIESYRQAIALDETYLEAMLNAAEVYIHPLGEFALEHAHSIEGVEELAGQGSNEFFIHPRHLLPQMPSVTANAESAARIRSGRSVNLPELSRARQVKVFYGQRELIAIATRVAGTLFHPGIVLAAESEPAPALQRR